MWRALMVLVYAACAVVALWPGLDLNPVLRGGIAAFFVGRSVASTLLLVARRPSGVMDPEHLLRSYLVLTYGYVISGILVGAGALLYGGMLGFLVAYAAFSFAWAWWWVRRTISRTREEQATS